MTEEVIYLDLRNFQADRSKIRRLEKNLKTSSQYVGKSGRVFFFKMDAYTKQLFYSSIRKAIIELGYKTEICYQTEKELLSK